MSKVIILHLWDLDRLMQILQEGTRPSGAHFLVCSGCGRVSNRIPEDAESTGWQLPPCVLCPECQVQEPYSGPARDRYLRMIEQMLEQG